jgi:RNA polymerase sigma factor (TIGR02999 family)
MPHPDNLTIYLGIKTMQKDPNDSVERVLAEIRSGKARADDELLSLVYNELRTVASRYLARERPSHTLQPTDLVNEAFAKLYGAKWLDKVSNRIHFFGILLRTMREILVEHARKKSARKRPPRNKRQRIDVVLDYFTENKLDPLVFKDALDTLTELNERQGQVVTLRVYFLFTMEEIASQLGVSLSTVESDWRAARQWLYDHLKEEDA